MIKIIILFLLSVPSVLSCSESGMKWLDDLIREGRSLKDVLASLDEDDVGANEEVRVENVPDDDSDRVIIKAYRGDRMILHLYWRKSWPERSFGISFRDGDTCLATIARMGDSKSTTILQNNDVEDYLIMVESHDELGLSITASTEGGFVEKIIINGRETRPISPVDYLKLKVEAEWGYRFSNVLSEQLKRDVEGENPN
jgi:hypothetical protein